MFICTSYILLKFCLNIIHLLFHKDIQMCVIILICQRILFCNNDEVCVWHGSYCGEQASFLQEHVMVSNCGWIVGFTNQVKNVNWVLYIGVKR